MAGSSRQITFSGPGAARAWQPRAPHSSCSASALCLPRYRLSSSLHPAAARSSQRSDAQHVRTRPGIPVCQAAAQAAVQLPQRLCSLRSEVDHLAQLLSKLQACTSLEDKVAVLKACPRVDGLLHSGGLNEAVLWELRTLSLEEQFVLLALPAIGQQHVLALPPKDEAVGPALRQLADALQRIDQFYSSIGGVVGYQHKCLSIILSATHSEAPAGQHGRQQQEEEQITFHMPQGPDLAGPDGQVLAARAAAAGLAALPHMAEVYPLGGAGDRLGLQCEVTGESVPTAMLPYCGRTLLEGLLRDLQAREYLHFRLTGRQHVTPVAIMTSDAKGNHGRVKALLEACDWFGRGQSAFKLFRQPLVPVVSVEDGRWLLPGALAPLLKPGGHGAIWKLMLDDGVFDWLSHQGRDAAIVRQISNPMAGMDATLLALAGTGWTDGRAFGFASCQRAVGAAEGMNVLLERSRRTPDGWEHTYNVTNLEYTEFEHLGVRDEAAAEGSAFSRFPANTNVLYIGLKAAEAAVRAGVAAGGGASLPGLIFNLNKKVTYRCAQLGRERTQLAGRMECTMQNLVDSLGQTFRQPLAPERHGDLSTFVTFAQRRKVTSSAKRRRAPGSTNLHQTPDGSFRDLQLNARDLLTRCGFADLPQVGEAGEYLERGPGFIFLWHPALGPLWDVVAQKLRGGRLAPGAELVLEVAEAAICQLEVDGSLLVQATAPVGQMEEALAINYSQIRGCKDLLVHQLDGRRQWYQYGSAGSHSARAVPLHQELSAHVAGQAAAAPSPDAASPAGGACRGNGKRRLVFSDRCGRIRLTNVAVRNEGVDWSDEGNVYWRHKVARRQACRIVLHGNAEFEASNVTLAGDCTFEVPDGHRLVVTADGRGGLRQALRPLADSAPTWAWRYAQSPEGDVQLTLAEAPCAAQPSSSAAASDVPYSYII